ncbi:cytochrome c [Angustibacter sp. Root456]|uniref:cytochrome bc1 complex diheme cytochrome c subunit n=1 Tax=Angustibacter sp. Root456 TaxID=1736539 RepID=UPI0006FCA4E9|nr:cytochrome c [Angustibacter sp. Root456]KQX64449.1 cystathionine beta-lyase [Angustibacter sp. Root456]
MTALAARRRHPLALVLLIALGLLATGGAYAALAPQPAAASTASADDVQQGKKLFLANCSSCHGLNAQGAPANSEGDVAAPSLIGVGAAAVDFQVGTGRMPLAAPGPQAQQKKVQFSQKEISQLAAYVASLAPGPSIPSTEYATAEGGDPGRGGAIFRVNCAMCHNFAGAGGALTRGKYAPSLENTTPKHIYEAMITGPQSMPVFNDSNITPQSKRDVIAYLKTTSNEPNAGGSSLGNLGPVPEGLFAWVVGIGALIGCAVWLGSKAA